MRVLSTSPVVRRRPPRSTRPSIPRRKLQNWRSRWPRPRPSRSVLLPRRLPRLKRRPVRPRNVRSFARLPAMPPPEVRATSPQRKSVLHAVRHDSRRCMMSWSVSLAISTAILPRMSLPSTAAVTARIPCPALMTRSRRTPFLQSQRRSVADSTVRTPRLSVPLTRMPRTMPL